jgi:hypothetical protein
MPRAKKSTPKITSPVDVDYPYASFRVACPVCGAHLWAGMEPPPVQGEEIIAGHDCPGRNPQLDATADDPPPVEQAPEATPPPFVAAHAVTPAVTPRPHADPL